MVAHSRASEQMVELGGPHTIEPEVVAQVNPLRREQIVGGRPLVLPAAEVQVLRDSEAGGEAKVECQRALGDPPVGRRYQPPLERDHLAQAHHQDTGAARRGEQALLEGRAERGGGRVPHVATLRSAPSISAITRRPRSAAPLRSPSGLARPSSTTWRTANSTWSGAVPASAASRIVRVGSPR